MADADPPFDSFVCLYAGYPSDTISWPVVVYHDWATAAKSGLMISPKNNDKIIIKNVSGSIKVSGLAKNLVPKSAVVGGSGNVIIHYLGHGVKEKKLWEVVSKRKLTDFEHGAKNAFLAQRHTIADQKLLERMFEAFREGGILLGKTFVDLKAWREEDKANEKKKRKSLCLAGDESQNTQHTQNEWYNTNKNIFSESQTSQNLTQLGWGESEGASIAGAKKKKFHDSQFENLVNTKAEVVTDAGVGGNSEEEAQSPVVRSQPEIDAEVQPCTQPNTQPNSEANTQPNSEANTQPNFSQPNTQPSTQPSSQFNTQTDNFLAPAPPQSIQGTDNDNDNDIDIDNDDDNVDDNDNDEPDPFTQA